MTVMSPRINWKTPSMSEDRIEEMALAVERLAGNISCYAGGGGIAHRLREIANEVRENIAPMP